MKCPNCKVVVKVGFERAYTKDYYYLDELERQEVVYVGECPNCSSIVVMIQNEEEEHEYAGGVGQIVTAIKSKKVVYPYSKTNQYKLDDTIPAELKGDFEEAVAVIDNSPKASAALSRRCLQNLFHHHLSVNHSNLYKEIDQFITDKMAPLYICEGLDAIRHIGNFSAHPLKSTSTGEILDVEEGEAEWCLDVLVSLFNFFFVEPARLQVKRDALNKKLKDAGKKPMI